MPQIMPFEFFSISGGTQAVKVVLYIGRTEEKEDAANRNRSLGVWTLILF